MYLRVVNMPLCLIGGENHDYVSFRCRLTRGHDSQPGALYLCLLYTSDAADELDGVDLGGRRIIKKKKR